jgi:hypothetical protein
MDIQFGLNMEWIQLTQDGVQATPVVNTEKKLYFLDDGEFFFVRCTTFFFQLRTLGT